MALNVFSKIVSFFSGAPYPFRSTSISTEGALQKYKIVFPCNKQATMEANQMARKAFGKENHIDPETIESWRLKNEKILSLLVDSKGNCRGYFDLIPLSLDFYDGLAKGKFHESNITAHQILSPNIHPSHIYIGGVTSNDHNPVVGSILLTSILLKLKYLYSKHPITIGALAATTDGEHYLKEFGFEEYPFGKGLRKDGMAFYQREISLRDIEAYLDEWGRRSQYLDYTSYRWYSIK